MGVTILGALKLEGVHARHHKSFIFVCFCPNKGSNNKKQL